MTTDRSVDIPGGITGDGTTWPVRFDPAIGKFVATVHDERITEETWSSIRARVQVEARRSQVRERTAALRRVAQAGVSLRDLATLTGLPRERIRQTLADAGASPALLARQNADEEGVAAELYGQSS